MKKQKTPKKTPRQAPSAIVKHKAETISVAEGVEKVLIQGDLTPLSPEQRLSYYHAVCKSLGLNPLTRPFDYIAFKATDTSPAKLILYAKKDCTEQLRKIRRISCTNVKRQIDDGLVIAEADVQDGQGRVDHGTGVVPIHGLNGKDLANAIMKAETKAKRRATLSICGLGFLDESELDTIDDYGFVTPGGRVAFPDVPKVGSREAAQRILEDKLAGKRPLHSEASPEPPVQDGGGIPAAAKVEKLADLPADAKQVTVDWHDKENPIVTGDSDAIEALKPLLEWRPDGFWHVKAVDAVKIGEACAAAKYRFAEILPETTSGKVPSTPEPAAREGGTRRSQAARAPAAEPDVVKGTIQHFTEKMTKGSESRPSAPFLSVLLKTDTGDRWYSIFKRDLIDHVGKAKGKSGEFFTVKNGNYQNIIGIKRIGNTEFEDNLPVIQKNREAGSPGLFK